MDWSPFVRDHFSALAEAHGTSGPVGVLVGLLASGELSEGAYKAHVSQLGLGREEWFRKQRLDLILGFVERALEQGPLTPERQQEIAHLKLALKVAEGEFAALRPVEIATILREQLAVVLADGEIDHGEDVYQVELQRAFDLGYDQYLTLGRSAFEHAMQALLDHQAALTQGYPDEQERIGRRIAALEPLYRLATARPRTPGALY